MQQTTLYTVESQQVIAGTMLEFSQAHVPYPDFTVTPAMDAIMTPSRTRISIPVHHLSKVIGYEGPGRPCERKDVFLAIHPELRQLLMVPLQEEFDRAQASEAMAVKKAADAMAARDEAEMHLSELEEELAAFAALPWWSRVWAVLTNKAPV